MTLLRHCFGMATLVVATVWPVVASAQTGDVGKSPPQQENTAKTEGPGNDAERATVDMLNEVSASSASRNAEPLASPTARPGETTTQNPVKIENAKTDGVTSAWSINGATHAFDSEIVGYASATSVNRGGTIDLYVHVADVANDPSYTIEVFRMGWYGGAGARKILPTITRTSVSQPACGIADPAINMVECDWAAPYTLQIPTSSDPTVAMSGVYLAKLTTARGLSSFIPFVVRDDQRVADFMFQASFTTYQAYNNYGGFSYYNVPGLVPNEHAAYKVSFNRPYSPRSSYGAGQFLNWEFNAVRFLEREGYNLVYSTNIDTHVDPERLKQFRGFLSVGHDEYWTRGMYDAIENARNAKVNLAFLGANTAYWQVRMEADARGRPNRRMVGYRYDAYAYDPFFGTPDSTTLWRYLNRPESGLVGVQYDHDPVDGDIVIADCPRWMCRGTGVGKGSVLRGMLGYEVDQVTSATPAGTTIIGRSPYVVNGQTRYANMTYYTHASGAGVFATGSMQWNWGLDGWKFDWVPASRTNTGVQAMTRNVLNRFLTSPAR